MKKTFKFLIILGLLFTILLASIVPVRAAIGKKTYAKNKYIWIYIDGERKILPSGYGYPCYGQGRDNKNVLYVPLSVIAEMCGCTVSPLKKQADSTAADGYKYYAEVTGAKTFTVYLYSDEINGVKLAGPTFILKGTDAAKTNVIMVPLGFAKDFFDLTTEVKRPVGRGVYDYGSLAINIKGGINNSSETVLNPPSSSGGNEDNEGTDTLYFVHAQDAYYHIGTCPSLVNDSLRAQLSEYEAIYWGYTKCPVCFPQATTYTVPTNNTVEEVQNTEENETEDSYEESDDDDEENSEED